VKVHARCEILAMGEYLKSNKKESTQ